MRIACVHVPQFGLQCLTRIDPSLRGAAVAVVGGGSSTDPRASGRSALLHGPIVLACSRAAWALGVRLGMTGTAANGLAPGQLRVVTADAALERETVRAIADALLGASTAVDVGGRVGAGGAHLAMYCEVPSKTRGTSYGDRLVEVLESLGLTARIGIADDRFTAWVAASHSGAAGDDAGVVSVPRGGSAAFLAPRPLSLLSITPEVQHMLEALGVCTLGQFAALPAPSVSRPMEADYQALARGDGGQTLRPYSPEAPVREQVVVTSTLPAAAAISLLSERIALRLTGRGRGAVRLELTVGAAAGERVVPIDALMSATAQLSGTGKVLDTAEELAEAISHAVGEERDPWRLAVTVIGEAVAGDAAVVAPAAEGSTHDLLSVVLASTGSTTSAPWQLTSPLRSSASTLRSERRDAHRGTRRTKQHRRTTAAGVIQPKLFADRRS